MFNIPDLPGRGKLIMRDPAARRRCFDPALYPEIWLRRRFPGMSPAVATTIAGLAGIGGERR